MATSLKLHTSSGISSEDLRQFEAGLKSIHPDLLVTMPIALSMIQQIDSGTSWTEAYSTQNWPSLLCEEIQSMDKTYGYRLADNGDSWDVFSVDMTGVTEWKATVADESFAIHLLEFF